MPKTISLSSCVSLFLLFNLVGSLVKLQGQTALDPNADLSSKDLLSLQEVLAAIAPESSVYSLRNYTPKSTQRMLMEALDHADEFYEDERFRRCFIPGSVELLGAVGDEAAVKYLREFMITNSKRIAAHNSKVKHREYVTPYSYGIAVGLLVYRKVPGAQALFDEMCTPEFWEQMAIIYPKIASRPEGYDRQKSYIALLMTEAAFFSGAKDPQQFLKKLEKLLPPDTSVEGGNENTWGPFSNVAEKLNAHKEWGEERFLQYIGETYILKDKKRAEIHENYKYLPEYLRKFVEQFEAKLEEEREAKLKQNAR